MSTGRMIHGCRTLVFLIAAIMSFCLAVIGGAARADSVTTPIKIGYSTALDRPTLGIPRWKAYMLETDPNQFWACYTTGSRTRNQISYTTDGGNTWSTNAIQIEPDGYLNMHCSVFGRNGNLYATWPGRDHITFRQFSAPIHDNADGGPLVPIPGTTVSYRSNIMVQNTGRIWLFTRLSLASTSENVLYNYSDNNGASFSHGTAYATNSNSVRIGSMPYVAGNPALVVLYLGDPRGFEYYLWNGTAFVAKPDHSIYPVNLRNSRAFTHNVIRDSTFHLIFSSGNSLHHMWKNYNNGTGSWNHEIIDNSTYTSDMDWSPISTVRGDDLYLFYGMKSTSSSSSSMVYERKWSQKTQSWTDPVLVSTDGAGFYDHDPNTCFSVPENSPYIPVYWSRGTGPFDIYFARVNVDNSTEIFVNCPQDTVSLNVCGAGEVCVPLEISNATGVTASLGVWQNDTLCLDADAEGIYTSTVTAVNASDTVICYVNVRVMFSPAIAISCPADTIDVVICSPAMLHIGLPIDNQIQVEVLGAIWAGNQLSFEADTSGIYSYLVTALNPCGSAVCQVSVRVLVWPNIDLYIAEGDVSVSDPEALSGETVTLSAIIQNAAGSVSASDIVVRFFDGDPDAGGSPIDIDQDISILYGGGSETASVQYMNGGTGSYDIYVVIDPDALIAECAEDNNEGILSIDSTASGATVSGIVTADTTPLHGVVINLLYGSGNEFLSAMTDIAGHYQFDAVSAGSYILEVDPPMGYVPTDLASAPITLSGSDIQIDFGLVDYASGETTSYWWWKKQVQAIRDGTELYMGLTRDDINDYCLAIFEQFFGRTDGFAIQIADVTFNGSPARALTYDDIARLWLDTVDESNTAKIRKHLLTCMLNIAAAHMSQSAAVSLDGATASQAITYYAGRYMRGDINWTIWYDLTKIHTGVMIGAGVIPLSTPDISYKFDNNNGDVLLPGTLTLSQNFPNPFNPTTEIRFVLSKTQTAVLEVFNIQGQRVSTLLDGVLPAGEHSILWDARSVASGVYVYRLTVGEFVKTRTMVLLK
jgi:hypothetical protein